MNIEETTSGNFKITRFKCLKFIIDYEMHTGSKLHIQVQILTDTPIDVQTTVP